jgi:transposase
MTTATDVGSSTMNKLLIPKELLGLNDVDILESILTSNGEIIIKVTSTKEDILCRRCGKRCEAHGKGEPLKLRHLPILGHETYIELIPPRGICKHCEFRPTTTQTLSWYKPNGRYTKPYEDHVLLSVVNSTLTDVSIKEGLSDTAIQNIINYNITDKVDWSKIKQIGIIGIDEISLKKGYQDFVTVIYSRINNTNKILAVLKGREKATIKTFFNSIPKKKRKTIVAVCCDMYDGYINAAREVFGSSVAVVVDRFHIAKLYRKSLLSLRKKELKRLRKALNTEEYKLLQPAISILVKKQECYTKKDKVELELLFKYSPALKAAYKLARQLTSIFNGHHHKETAVKKINEWVAKVNDSKISCFNTFVTTIIKYKDEVSNYFIGRNTSGFVEGLNNKLKVIKRRCYGIVNRKNYFQRVFLDLEGYKLFLNNSAIAA